MPFFSMWINVIVIIAATFPFYSVAETSFIPTNNQDEPNCSEFASHLYMCTRELYPVCGTDGKTYGNICAFCSSKIASNNRFGFHHYGEC